MSEATPTASRLVRGACPHDCPDTCALQITVADGKVMKVAGDPDHPPTHGALCTKVSRYAERSYHPDRRSGSWPRDLWISWPYNQSMRSSTSLICHVECLAGGAHSQLWRVWPVVWG